MPSSSAVLKGRGDTSTTNQALRFKRTLLGRLITNCARAKQLSQDHNHITTYIGGTCVQRGALMLWWRGEPCAWPITERQKGGLRHLESRVPRRKCFFLSVFVCSQSLLAMLCVLSFKKDVSFLITIKEDELNKRGRWAAFIVTIESF